MAPQNPNSDSPSVIDMLNSVASGDPMAGLAASQQPPSPLLPAPPTSSVPAPIAAAAQMPADSRQLSPASDTNRAAGPYTTDTTPEPSDGGHVGFLDKLKHFATSPSGLASTLGGVGNALTLALGGPQQKQLAVEQEQIPLKMQQLQNEASWRRGMLGVNQQNANTKGEVAATGEKTEHDKFAVADNALGLPEGTMRMQAETARQNEVSNQQLRQEHIKQLEATMNGEVRVPPGMGHAIGRDDLEGKSLPALEFTQKVATPYKLLGVKSQDLGEDGVWGVSPLTGRVTQLGKSSPSEARSNSMLLRTQLPVNDAQGNTLGWVNPQTNTMTSVNDIHGKAGGPSLAAQEGGGVIPPKPTQMILSQGQQGAAVDAQIPRIKQEVLELGAQVGPAPGRWNNFWVNKGGIDNPAYSKVDQDLTFLSSALAKAHFGGSPPEGIAESLKKNFGLAQSPDDLNARIDSADAWMEGYATRVNAGKGAAPKNTPAAKTAAAPEPQQSTGHKVGDSIIQNGRTFTVKAVDKNGKVTDAQ